MQEILKHIKNPHNWFITAVFIISVSLIYFSFYRNGVTRHEAEIIEGKVISIVSERTIGEEDFAFIGVRKEQELVVEILENGLPRQITVINDFIETKEGEKLFLRPSVFAGDGQEIYEVMEISRTANILALAGFFTFLVLVVSGYKGLKALIGLLFSFAIILTFIIPGILKGASPILVTLAGSVLILLLTLYTAYGFNKKTFSALVGISATLFFVGLLASFSTAALRLGGLAGEEAFFLKMEAESLNLAGILVAGIIIAAIGVLDDIAITQASLVQELALANPNLGRTKLFRKSMEVGKDHISAVINTLILAYTGAALPLVLLFSLRELPGEYIVSSEIIAEEIARTLVSSSGLVMAVPITTLIAVLLMKKKSARKKEEPAEQV